MEIPIKLLFFYFSAFLGSIFLAISILLIATTKEYPLVIRSKKEKRFVDPNTGNDHLFPSIEEEASITLSVVIPAYNEEERCRI